jgi:hypothetical protein
VGKGNREQSIFKGFFRGRKACLKIRFFRFRQKRKKKIVQKSEEGFPVAVAISKTYENKQANSFSGQESKLLKP